LQHPCWYNPICLQYHLYACVVFFMSSFQWNSSTCVIKGNRTHFISLRSCCFLCIILCSSHLIAALKTSSSEEMFQLSLITVFPKVNWSWMDIQSSKGVWITGPSTKFIGHSHTPQRRW
jgi:hypothetical protein